MGDFDQIGPDDAARREQAHNLDQLGGPEPTRLGGAGARRFGRVEDE